MFGFLKKIFKSHNEKEIARLQIMVEEINALEKDIVELSEEQILEKIKGFKAHVLEKKDQISKDVEALKEEMSAMTSPQEKDKVKIKIKKINNTMFEDVLAEVFAVVREVAKRKLNMRHFDVQLIGGMVLHEGNIAEMATGEGKTLAATLPVCLNALTGDGVHVVTVNDYLAERDMNWMRPVYEFMGFSVGVIKHDMSPSQRQESYKCDIVYGTNNEFGFDYLRDNLVVSRKDIVQCKHNFAIVDEVDSILIDEARTPLIISGPVDTINTAFAENRAVVDSIVKQQSRLIHELISELRTVMDKDEDRTKKLLYIIHKGSPKEREYLDIIMKDAKIKGIADRAVTEYDSKLMEQDRTELLEQLYYTFEERNRESIFTGKGEAFMKEKFDIDFMIQDLEIKLAELAGNDAISDEEKIKQEETITEEYVKQQKQVDSIKQLLKAYVLFKKEVDYVIQENKILIVDEFTGRMMPGRRFSDGLHEAIEAKERVKVQQESQTHATITLQNYFKMYDKLSGMTGTAKTEENEFSKIYGLEVVAIPTNKPLKRLNYPDVIYKTEKEKFSSICDDIERLHKEGAPVLVGTISIEKSEVLGAMLSRRGIPHNVLNAKYHENEAHIVAQAGRKGGVTIATNMAGRGTDILLGGNAQYLATDAVERLNIDNMEEKKNVFKKYFSEYQENAIQQQKEVLEAGGLHVLGTERHESRRVDNQLRGRSGRQGDPGASKFYLSLEDDLMRIFGSDRIRMVMEKLGMEEGQDIQHPLVSRAIGTAQKRVEMQNFEMRQHLLKFDNVMNQQREMIYDRRRAVIFGENIKEEIMRILEDTISSWLDEIDLDQENFAEDLKKKIFLKLLISFKKEDLEDLSKEDLFNKIFDTAKAHYERREKFFDKEKMSHFESMVMLSVIDVNWKDYLFNLDQLREGINWRAYGQKDPLVEYQHEAFGMFRQLIYTIDEETIEKLFKNYAVQEQMIKGSIDLRKENFVHETLAPMHSKAVPQGKTSMKTNMDLPVETVSRDVPKVGRNDACPCGSGKKYKKCCGK